MSAEEQAQEPINPDGATHPVTTSHTTALGHARLQRRRRLHELVLALIAQQDDLELLDGEALLSGASGAYNPASWLEHNRRLIQRYQAVVRTAATLDALIDQEMGDGPSPSGRQA